MADQRIQDVWQAAVDRYKEKTGHSLADAWPEMPEHFDLATVLARIDEDNEKYGKYKERRKSLHEALDPVLHIVESLAESAGETGALFYPPSKAISVAVLWLLAAGRNYGARYDTIIEVFADLKRTLGRVKIHSAHVMTTELRASMIETLGYILVLLGTARKALEGGRLKQFLNIAGGKSEELTKAMGKLDKLTAQENSVVSAETLSTVNTLLDRLDQGIEAQIHESLRAISASIQSMRDEGFSGWLRSWLNPPDASYNHKRHLLSREDQTGLWFLQGSQFTQWKQATDSFLWIQGPPGCGKSVLCSSAIDAVAQDPSSIYVYFYFDFNDKSKQNYEGLLFWLLLQLAGCFETVPASLAQLRKISRDGAQCPGRSEIFQAIRELCSAFSDIYLMLDALDECSSTELDSVFGFVDDLRQDDRFGLHTLVTSRPQPDIVDRLKRQENMTAITIVLAEDVVQHDIELYVQERVKNDSRLNRHGELVCNMIQKHLCENAKGMFRWVSLQLNHLGTCRTPAKVKKALEELPPTLVATYSHILRSIATEDITYVAMMLPYLIYSQRLLTMNELAAAAAVDLDSDDPLDPENRFSDPEEVLRLCPGLVTLFMDPKDHEDETTYVQLAHFSVKEYLVSDAAREYADHLNFRHERAHYVIFRTSLHVLDSLDEPDMTYKTCIQQQPLGRHAAEFWPYHLRLSLCSVRSDSNAWPQLRRLFDHTQHCLANWIRCYDPDTELDFGDFVVRTTADAADPIYYASLFGVYDVCLSLLDEGVVVNAKMNKVHISTLAAACYRGQAEVARLLLDRSANVNITGGVYGSALGAACYQGHAEVVRLLLERGANTNISGGIYESALAAACARGHAEIARLLLDRGADVNISCELYGSALGAACLCGNIELAQLLLDRGADVVPRDNSQSALEAACSGGNVELVQLLLDRGADINISSGLDGSALGAACTSGHVEVARLLLSRGADVNIPGGECGSALTAVCSWGDVELAQMLLDRGADINMPGGKHGSALGAACSGGDVELAQLLLDRGADINITGGEYGSALGAACNSAHANIVQMLLTQGCDISLVGPQCLSAVQAMLLDNFGGGANELILRRRKVVIRSAMERKRSLRAIKKTLSLSIAHTPQICLHVNGRSDGLDL